MIKNLRELFTREERARKQMVGPVLIANGLTPGQGQAKILNNLFEEEGLTQKELSLRCHIDTTTMSRNIDKLENLGLLSRRMNPESRRAVSIYLTEMGKDKARIIHEMFTRFEAILKKDISAEELEIFERVLMKMCDNLEEEIPKENQF
ncbi:MarR family winged helix-turn-helix transcriptional regulator [Anaeromicropila herbilytica]|uniref:HTH marR-type domain-containing protein n=1 Tax=Anaeromicropila herbilytica TaxID=2785025 RepID=A0A7R7EI87_9FIRM|nr:MarR family transcriptional regulator [Anaeromicropila herbilytica]BCN29248.1 hypothetical protein bsdtb5_05430 [Anaeromicropila herbilytica]